MVSHWSVVACAVIWYSYVPRNRKKVTAVRPVPSSAYVYLKAKPGIPLTLTGLSSRRPSPEGSELMSWSTIPCSSVLICWTSVGLISRASS